MPLAPQVTITPENVGGVDYAISAVSYTSSTATYTATGHTFNVGDLVTITGIVPDGYNGTFTITAMVAGSTFTVANTTNAAVTDAVGDAYQAPSTDYDFDSTPIVYTTDNEDVSSIVSQNPDLVAALAAATDAQTNAAAANAAATSAAYTAGVAQSTANGKNTSHYSTSGPSGSGSTGDLWFTVDGSGHVTAQYIYNGGWQVAPITNTVISNLDAGKITGGTITGIAYNNGSGTFSVSPTGVLVATSATITGSIIATTGTFTGTIYAASGTIGGITIGSNYLYTGNLGLYADGTISSTNNAYFKHLSLNGATLGSNDLAVAGTAAFNSTVTTVGNIYDLGGATTTSSANVYMNSVSGLIARVTSSERYKVEIKPETIPNESIMALVPKSYVDKVEAEEKGTTDGLPRYLGLIAEDVAQIPVIGDLLVNRNEAGQPDSVNYDRVASALIPLLQDLNRRVALLEGK